MIKIGVCGCGNMGRSILLGWAGNAELRKEYSFYAFDRIAERAVADGVTAMPDALALATEVDILLMALKPDQMEAGLKEVAPGLKPGNLLISIAAGTMLAKISDLTQGRCPLVRVMPNTPAMVSQGLFGICFEALEGWNGDSKAADLYKNKVLQLFSALGKTYQIPESKINAFTALAGSGPGYVFYLMDALVEAGVTIGFTRPDATDMIYGLFKGCVALGEAEGQHLAVLRENVCSPAGTTIAGINHLDRTGVKGHIVDATVAACLRGEQLG